MPWQLAMVSQRIPIHVFRALQFVRRETVVTAAPIDLVAGFEKPLVLVVDGRSFDPTRSRVRSLRSRLYRCSSPCAEAERLIKDSPRPLLFWT